MFGPLWLLPKWHRPSSNSFISKDKYKQIRTKGSVFPMKSRRGHANVLAFGGNHDTPEQQGHPSCTVECGEQACVSQAGKQKILSVRNWAPDMFIPRSSQLIDIVFLYWRQLTNTIWRVEISNDVSSISQQVSALQFNWNLCTNICPLCRTDEWHFSISTGSSPRPAHRVRFLSLCPAALCHWRGGVRSRSPGASHWPPRRCARPLIRFAWLASPWLGAACPWRRPVSKSWRRGGRRRRRISKWGGSKGEPGSHTFPWSSTGWCEWRLQQTASDVRAKWWHVRKIQTTKRIIIINRDPQAGWQSYTSSTRGISGNEAPQQRVHSKNTWWHAPSH